ncbi:MAG TPA: hypothetical protein VJ437_11170 [Acidiferrobacterales bacterium]|nr:hypothetical protein [Acidiferrobacterales bacterium]
MKPRITQRPNPKLAELVEMLAEIAVADYLAELETRAQPEQEVPRVEARV